MLQPLEVMRTRQISIVLKALRLTIAYWHDNTYYINALHMQNVLSVNNCFVEVIIIIMVIIKKILLLLFLNIYTG